MKTKQTGFTLVEIAIVLVIIGLLLGGILKGQEMIVQAKVKNSITDFSGISAAYFGYQDRYRAIPGDDAAATRWAGATVSATAGDRVLTGLYVPTTPATDETGLWWDHLRRSGFVTGAGVGNPQNSFGGTIGVQQGDGTGVGATAAKAVLPATTGFTNLIMCSSNLPDKVAIALDVQMDDGVATTGAVRATDAAGIAPAIGITTTMSTSAYVENGTTIYALCRQF